MLSESVFVAITMEGDEPLRIMQFLTRGRGDTLPSGATWDPKAPGWWLRPASPENLINEVGRSCPEFGFIDGGAKIPLPQAKTWRVISQTDVEAACADRTFRDALVDKDRRGGLKHDMPVARKIHMDHVRQARTEEFGRLDREWMKATGQGDKATAAAIEVKRQTLRDAPLLLATDTAKTVEELKAMWPADLPR